MLYLYYIYILYYYYIYYTLYPIAYLNSVAMGSQGQGKEQGNSLSLQYPIPYS